MRNVFGRWASLGLLAVASVALGACNDVLEMPGGALADQKASADAASQDAASQDAASQDAASQDAAPADSQLLGNVRAEGGSVDLSSTDALTADGVSADAPNDLRDVTDVAFDVAPNDVLTEDANRNEASFDSGHEDRGEVDVFVDAAHDGETSAQTPGDGGSLADSGCLAKSPCDANHCGAQTDNCGVAVRCPFNACGGCGPLAGAVGGECTDTLGGPGTYTCSGNSLVCASARRNRCGQLAPESECNYCVCTGITPALGCGNGSIGGDYGDFMANVTQSDVTKYYHPGPSTGWTCFAPSSVRGSGGPQACYCPHGCGNGGYGGDPLGLDLGVSSAEATSSSKYGPGTGWFCGRLR